MSVKNETYKKDFEFLAGTYEHVKYFVSECGTGERC